MPITPKFKIAPPLDVAELLVKVLFVIVRMALLNIAPPLDAELLVKVLLVMVTVPLLKIAPPLRAELLMKTLLVIVAMAEELFTIAPPVSVAKLFVNVLFWMVSVPLLIIAPPSVKPPLFSVNPLRVSDAPVFTAKKRPGGNVKKVTVLPLAFRVTSALMINSKVKKTIVPLQAKVIVPPPELASAMACEIVPGPEKLVQSVTVASMACVV